jgi:hypothetical protein
VIGWLTLPLLAVIAVVFLADAIGMDALVVYASLSATIHPDLDRDGWRS